MKFRAFLMLTVFLMAGCQKAPPEVPVPAPEDLSGGYGAPEPVIVPLSDTDTQAVRQALEGTDRLRQIMESCIQRKDFRCPAARFQTPLSSIPLRMGNGAGIDPASGEARVHLYIDRGSEALQGKSISWVRFPSDKKWRCFSQGLAQRAGVSKPVCS